MPNGIAALHVGLDRTRRAIEGSRQELRRMGVVFEADGNISPWDHPSDSKHPAHEAYRTLHFLWRLEAGVHPRAVADRLGHATPSLVMNVYGHATERMQHQATAAMGSVLSGASA